MEIFSHGKDIYAGLKTCNLCGCVFSPTREDAVVYYENLVCNHYVECPNCYTLIPVALSARQMLNVVRKDKEEDEK